MAARSLSGAVKSLCSAASGSLSCSIVLRRSYVATSQNVTAAGLSKGGSTRVMVGKMEQRGLDQEAESAWGPDPVTGWHCPSFSPSVFFFFFFLSSLRVFSRNF